MPLKQSYKTRACGSLTAADADQEVILAGWVANRRDHGKLIFLDLRDKEGLIQIVINPEVSKEAHEAAKDVRGEYILQVTGKINKRPDKLVNKDLSTGEVELEATDVKVLNKAETPPIDVLEDGHEINEASRMKYRYLDLRRPRMKRNIVMRHKVINYVSKYLDEAGFVNIQTPILTKSTPEGARDYLVPSRVHPGKFFALPQAPQQYKQLLMVAGFEKYFQIAPCFRDEDARADRSPGEFYQLDMEMSFVKQDDILNFVETMFTEMVKKLFPEKKITQEPWPRLDYDETMEKYGTDKPDLRKDKKDPNELAFAWIVNFPLFTKQSDEDFFHGAGKTWGPTHNMFTAPKEEDLPLLDTDPGKAKSYQHDLVLNGTEVGGGAIRIHDPKVQEKVFDLIGLDAKQKEQFAHILEAFTYGVPPHGGIAPGLDRLLSILLGEKNIREVVAFPLNSDVRDPLMGAPSEVSKEQLRELGVEIKKDKKDD